MVTEHAIRMSDGSMQVRNSDPELERIYPFERWVENQQRSGGTVYRRRIVVVEDWTEVNNT